MIRLSAEARADLRDIVVRAAAQFGEAVAGGLIGKILADLRLLERFPQIGRVGRCPDTRERTIAGCPFVVIYEPLADVRAVYRVIHGAMQRPPDSDH